MNISTTILLIIIAISLISSCRPKSANTLTPIERFKRMKQVQDSINVEIISRIENIDTVLCNEFGNNATIQFDSTSFCYLSEEKRNNIRIYLKAYQGELIIINNKYMECVGLFLTANDSSLTISSMTYSDAGVGTKYRLEKNNNKYIIKEPIGNLLY